jgi:hypothetical protein
MAGHYRYTAVLDACVLYPAPLRDLLLSLASEGLFAARWTEQIQAEWRKSAEELIATYEKQSLPQLCKILSVATDLI